MRSQICADEIARNKAGVSEGGVSVTPCLDIGEPQRRSDRGVVHNRSRAGVKVAQDVKVSSLDATSFDSFEYRQLLTERILTIRTRNIAQPVRSRGHVEWGIPGGQITLPRERGGAVQCDEPRQFLLCRTFGLELQSDDRTNVWCNLARRAGRTACHLCPCLKERMHQCGRKATTYDRDTVQLRGKRRHQPFRKVDAVDGRGTEIRRCP